MDPVPTSAYCVEQTQSGFSPLLRFYFAVNFRHDAQERVVRLAEQFFFHPFLRILYNKKSPCHGSLLSGQSNELRYLKALRRDPE